MTCGADTLPSWERSLHQLLFALTDRTASSGQKIPALFLVFLPVLFDVIDFFQLIAALFISLARPPRPARPRAGTRSTPLPAGLTFGVGWDRRAIQWLLNLSAFFHVNWCPGATTTATATSTTPLTLCPPPPLPAHSFQRNSVRILPIRIVRLLATVFQTALYIPALQLLTQELAVVGNSPSSSLWLVSDRRPGWEWALYAAASSVSLVLFVPFMLLISLVYVDTNPTSRSMDACAHGRVSFLYTLVRTVLVFCVRFLNPTGTAAVLAILLGITFFALYAYLPFYRKNPLMGGLFVSACWCSVASLVLSRIGDPDTHVRFVASSVFQAFSIPVFLGGWWAVSARTRTIMLKGRAIAKEGLPPGATGDLTAVLFPAVAAAQERGGESGVASANASRGASFRWPRRSASGNAPMWGRSLRRAVAPVNPNDPDAPPSRLAGLGSLEAQNGTSEPHSEPGFVPGTVPRTGVPVVSALLHLYRSLRQRLLVFWTPHETLRVEVSTRFIAFDHSDEALDDAEAVYQSAYQLFPDSAYVRLSHAVFLAIHRGNPMSALQVHRQAWNCKPAFDVRFALEAMKRDFEQRTASSNLGEDGVDYIAVLEYRRLHDVATKSHNEAIARLRGLWKTLAKTRLPDAALQGLPRRLEGVDQASRAAGEAYRSLLSKFPNSKLLLREYGSFLDNVANEPELAKMHFNAADEIEEQQAADGGDGGGSASGSQGNGSFTKKGPQKAGRAVVRYGGSQSGSSSSSDFAARARMEQQRAKETWLKRLWLRPAPPARPARPAPSWLGLRRSAADVRHVKRVRVGIVVGLFVIAGLCSVFFVVIQQVLQNLSRSIYRIVASASQMRRLVEFSFMTRTLNLLAHSNELDTIEETRKELMETVELFSHDLRGLYLGFHDDGIPASTSDAAIALWNEPNVELVRHIEGSPAATRLQEKTSLWVANSYLAGVVANTAQLSLADLAVISSSETFQFIEENGPGTMLVAAGRSVRIYEEEIYSSTQTSKILIGVILAVTVAVLVAIGVFVFRPAFEKVRRTMRGVSELVLALPAPVRKAMYNKFAKMRRIDDVAADDVPAPDRDHQESDEEEEGGEGNVSDHEEGGAEKPARAAQTRSPPSGEEGGAGTASALASAAASGAGTERARADSSDDFRVVVAGARKLLPSIHSLADAPLRTSFRIPKDAGGAVKPPSEVRLRFDLAPPSAAEQGTVPAGSGAGSRTGSPPPAPAAPAPAPAPASASLPPLPRRPAPGEARLALAGDEIAKARAERPESARGTGAAPGSSKSSSSDAAGEQQQQEGGPRVTMYDVSSAPSPSPPPDATGPSAPSAPAPAPGREAAPAAEAEAGAGAEIGAGKGSIEGDGAGGAPASQEGLASLAPASLEGPPSPPDAMETVYHTLAVGAASFKASGFLRRESNTASEDEVELAAKAAAAAAAKSRGGAQKGEKGEGGGEGKEGAEKGAKHRGRRRSADAGGKEDGAAAGSGGEGEGGGKDRLSRRASHASAGSDKSDELDGPQGRRGGTSDIVTALTRRYITAFFVIAIITAANFTMCFVLLDETQYVAGYIREAGRSNGSTLNLPAILRKLHSAVRALADSQRALVQGNSTMQMPPNLARYAPQDRLLFEERCMLSDASMCEAITIADPARVTSGLDFMMQSVVHSGLAVDEGRLAALEAAPPAALYDYAAIRATSPGP
eukprot:tig00000248_g21774.t2